MVTTPDTIALATNKRGQDAETRLTTVLLNLPHETQVMRRYMCTSLAPNYLFPPQELLALGGIVKEWKRDSSVLIDAIAEKMNLNTVIRRLREINPRIVVTLSGFETFEHDMDKLSRLKKALPESKFTLFGHYPTHFPEEVLENVSVDYIILGEPDLVFSELYDCILDARDISEIKGIAYKNGEGRSVIQPGDERIPDPNMLPMPSYDLADADKYYEPFMPMPFGLIQSARGCPYQCNYCVKSFGTKLTLMKPERIIRDIRFLVDHFGIKSLRFIDDTFTAIPKRVIELCELMIKNNIELKWTCLSRVDTINEEMLKWMKKAGCKRIYFGVESGSQRILNHLNKRVDIRQGIDNLLMCRKYGIETAGFFILGYPMETEEDFEASLDFAIRSKLNFIVLSELTPYPGTALFHQLKEHIDFSILPYRNEFKNKEIHNRYRELETLFYRKFYFRISYMIQNLPVLLKNSLEILEVVKGLAVYMLKNKSVAMPKYKEVNTGKHIVTFKPA